MLILCKIVSGFQKRHLFFVRQLEMPQNAFQKCDVITFTCFFFGHCTDENKDIALKFCMLVVCIHLYHTYSGFSDKLKISDFKSNYFWKNRGFELLESKMKISKIRDSHFIERLILHRLAFFFYCVLFQK